MRIRIAVNCCLHATVFSTLILSSMLLDAQNVNVLTWHNDIRKDWTEHQPNPGSNQT
jgi:hypothetical protein